MIHETETMRAAGYQTYMCGKWHVCRDIRPNGDKSDWPVQRGFEKFYGTISGGGSFYDPTTLCRQNTYITPQNDPEYKPKVRNANNGTRSRRNSRAAVISSVVRDWASEEDVVTSLTIEFSVT